MRLLGWVENFISTHDHRAAQVTRFCVENPEDTKIMYDYPMGPQSRLFVSESRDLIYIKSVYPLDFSYYPPGTLGPLNKTKIDKTGYHFDMGGDVIHCYYWYYGDDEQDDDENCTAETRLKKIDDWLRGKVFH